MEAELYYTIDKVSSTEYKERGSRFIAYAIPVGSVDEFKQRLDEIRKLHPKATHHCFAYRVGIDKNLFRVSDDGEPSGTAGKPILNQIDSKGLTNTLIVVVRYFGGTLLGVPGLINAYKSAASMVLQITPVISKAIVENYRVHFNYPQLNDILMIVKQHSCLIISQDLSLFCTLTIGVPKSKVKEVIYRLEDMRDVEVQVEKPSNL